jgi:uncharacterized protein (UPF0218 family)
MLFFVTTLILTEQQRQLLKKPLGELIRGSPTESALKLRELVVKDKPPRLVLVGDGVSRNALAVGVKPDVIIIDRMEKRERATRLDPVTKYVLQAVNPAGTITQQARQVVQDALRIGDSLVDVQGEEDLLALVAITSSPEGSLVVYGQPDEGVVLVKVSADKRAEVSRIIAQMKKRT